MTVLALAAGIQATWAITFGTLYARWHSRVERAEQNAQ